MYWKEAYVTASKDTKAPNHIWIKRPYGQHIKCTEANGLRIALPDSIGALPTYEEMAGKTEVLDTDKILEFPSVNGIDKFKQALNISTETQKTAIEEVNPPECSNQDPSVEDSLYESIPKEAMKKELPLMPIGKYKGKCLDEVPEDYLQWLAANNLNYKALAEQELARRNAH